MTALSVPARYLLVSGLCWLMWMVGIPALNHAGIHYAPATAIAFTVIAITGFWLHCWITFDAERTLRAFLRYNAAMLLNLPVTIIIIGIGHDGLGLPVFAATLLASVLLFLWNYVAIAWAVKRPAKEDVHGHQ